MCDATSMKVRAAVLEQFAAPLVVQEVDLGAPRRGEVLVRLHACGICHTDMYTASGADPSGYAPCVLGHEGAGAVEAVGEGVASLQAGDHVVTLFSPQCGECVTCRSGKTNICVAIRELSRTGFHGDWVCRFLCFIFCSIEGPRTGERLGPAGAVRPLSAPRRGLSGTKLRQRWCSRERPGRWQRNRRRPLRSNAF